MRGLQSLLRGSPAPSSGPLDCAPTVRSDYDIAELATLQTAATFKAGARDESRPASLAEAPTVPAGITLRELREVQGSGGSSCRPGHASPSGVDAQPSSTATTPTQSAERCMLWGGSSAPAAVAAGHDRSSPLTSQVREPLGGGQENVGLAWQDWGH
jgi:hypothetical protein